MYFGGSEMRHQQSRNSGVGSSDGSSRPCIAWVRGGASGRCRPAISARWRMSRQTHSVGPIRPSRNGHAARPHDGIHVLTQQGDLARAAPQPGVAPRPPTSSTLRGNSAPRVWHDAERCRTCRSPPATVRKPRCPAGAARIGQVVELRTHGNSVSRMPTPRPAGAAARNGAPPFREGGDRSADRRSTWGALPHDLLALGLGHAAGGGDDQRHRRPAWPDGARFAIARSRAARFRPERLRRRTPSTAGCGGVSGDHAMTGTIRRCQPVTRSERHGTSAIARGVAGRSSGDARRSYDEEFLPPRSCFTCPSGGLHGGVHCLFGFASERGRGSLASPRRTKCTSLPLPAPPRTRFSAASRRPASGDGHAFGDRPLAMLAEGLAGRSWASVTGG